MEDYIKIITDSSIIVNRVAFLLEQQNIPIHIKDKIESARLGGFGFQHNEIELYVHKAEFENSQNIIEDFNKVINQ